MKRLFALLPIASMLLTGASALGQEKPPAWAYPVNPPDFKAPPDDGTPRKVPDSDLTLTLTQVRDLFFRRTGIQAIILRSLRWWPAAASRRCSRAASVIAPMARAVRRMQTSWVCRLTTSNNRLPISRAARGNRP